MPKAIESGGRPPHQRQVPGRVPERGGVLQPGRGPCRHRTLAAGLQPGQAALGAWRPDPRCRTPPPRGRGRAAALPGWLRRPAAPTSAGYRLQTPRALTMNAGSMGGRPRPTTAAADNHPVDRTGHGYEAVLPAGADDAAGGCGRHSRSGPATTPHHRADHLATPTVRQVPDPWAYRRARTCRPAAGRVSPSGGGSRRARQAAHCRSAASFPEGVAPVWNFRRRR